MVESKAAPLIEGTGSSAEASGEASGEASPPGDKNINPRILFLDHVGVLGGAELSLIDMVRCLGNQNHVILMGEGPLKAALEATGVGVTTLVAAQKLSRFRRNSGIFLAIKSAPSVLGMAMRVARRARDYDIIWANSQKSFVIGCLAATIARRPLVWHMRDILSDEHFSRLSRHVAVFLANRCASKVVTVSDAGLASFVASKGRPGLASVVYNGIDSAPFDRIDVALHRSKLRGELGIGDAPLVGAFGRLTSWKGQHVLIAALKSLPGVHALIVGDALFREREYAQSLVSLAQELGVTDRTHFAGFRDDIPELMSAVDLVVHTSIAPEPFGRVIVEAMLARRPIIATDAGGAKEIITQGKDGILVPPSQSAALAAAISELLADPARKQAIAESGYETAIRNFSLRSFAKNIERIQDEVTGRAQSAIARAC